MVEVTARTEHTNIGGTRAPVVALSCDRYSVGRIAAFTPVRGRFLSVDTLIALTSRHCTCFTVITLVVDKYRLERIATCRRLTCDVYVREYAFVVDTSIRRAGKLVVAVSIDVTARCIDYVSTES